MLNGRLHKLLDKRMFLHKNGKMSNQITRRYNLMSLWIATRTMIMNWKKEYNVRLLRNL